MNFEWHFWFTPIANIENMVVVKHIAQCPPSTWRYNLRPIMRKFLTSHSPLECMVSYRKGFWHCHDVPLYSNEHKLATLSVSRGLTLRSKYQFFKERRKEVSGCNTIWSPLWICCQDIISAYINLPGHWHLIYIKVLNHEQSILQVRSS